MTVKSTKSTQQRAFRRDPNLNIRLTTQDDAKLIIDSVNDGRNGGSGYFRAVFGAYNIPALIDLSVLSLAADEKVTKVDTNDSEYISTAFRGFISLDDTISCMPDPHIFDGAISILKNYISVNVSRCALPMSFHCS